VRRLLALLFVLATVMVVPVVPAAAQDERVEVVVVAEEFPAGVSADGATLTAGTYALLFEGVVVDAGTVEGRYYDRGTGVHGTRHFVSDITGAFTDTEVKALIVDVDDSGDPVVVTYVFDELIVANSDGATGHGGGVAVLSGFADGSFVLATTSTAILDLG